MSVGPALIALMSHWRRAPLQLFTLLVGLALATALWSGVQAINSEAKASYGAATAQISTGQLDQLVAPQGDSLRISDYVRLRLAGWRVTPQVDGMLRVGDRDIRVLGIDPLTAPPLSANQAIETLPLDRFFSPEGFAFVAQDLLAEAKTLGLDFEVETTLASGLMVMDIGRAATMLGRGDSLDQL